MSRKVVPPITPILRYGGKTPESITVLCWDCRDKPPDSVELLRVVLLFLIPLGTGDAEEINVFRKCLVLPPQLAPSGPALEAPVVPRSSLICVFHFSLQCSI